MDFFQVLQYGTQDSEFIWKDKYLPEIYVPCFKATFFVSN